MALVGQNRCIAIDAGTWNTSLNNGQWPGETTFGTLNATNNWRNLLIETDGFTIEPTTDLITDDVQDCTTNPPKNIKTGDTFEGQVIAKLRPSTAKMTLDMLVGRNSSLNLQSWSIQHHAEIATADTDGGVGYNYTGVSCFSATLSASRDPGFALATATMRCKKRDPIAVAIAVPITVESPYLFKNSKAVLYDNRTGERFAEGDLESLTIELNNNGQDGKKARQFFESPPSSGDSEFSGVVESLLMGRTDARGTATILWKEARWDKLQRDFAKLVISLGFFHPNSIRSPFKFDSDLAFGDTRLEIAMSPFTFVPSPGLRGSPNAWSVWAIEGYATSSSPNSGQRTSFHPVGTSPFQVSPLSTTYDIKGQGIRWSTGIGVSPGYVYNRAMEWALPDCRITNVQKTGPNAEQLRVNITFACQKNTVALEDRFSNPAGAAFQYVVSDFD